MSLSALLTDLARADIHLALVDDRIEADAPTGALTPALVADLTAHKPALLLALAEPGWPMRRAAGQARTVPPVRCHGIP
jgi:hypothetical protein